MDFEILQNQFLLEKTMLLKQLETINNSVYIDIQECILSETVLNEEISYYEVRSFITYLNKHVTDSATRKILNEIIKAMTKLELSATRVTALFPQRIAQSRPILQK